jgi:hypothetical protein
MADYPCPPILNDVPQPEFLVSCALLLIQRRVAGSRYPSAESRLPESLHFAESDVIVGVVRVRSVHKVVYGHNGDWAAA